MALLFFSISFLVTFLSSPLLGNLAVKLEILDFPAKRKIHKKATPLLGGLAIYLGLLIGLLFNIRDFYYFLPLIIASTIILVIGLTDDIIGLSAQFRLICQLLAVSVIIGSGIRVSFLPDNILGDIGEVAITVFWIIGVINAFNYLDGLDGLATGSAIVNLFCFEIILFISGQESLGMLSIIIIAACLGFLPYNFRQAKMFLGDAGSTLLGFLLACIGLMGSWAEDNIVKISIPVLILGVPIFDMIFTTIMRIKEGKVKTIIEWIQYAGKDHFHHYLVDLGLKPSGAVIFIYLTTLSLGISAIMLRNDNAYEAILTFSQAFLIFGIIAVLIVVGKKRRSGWKIHEE